MAQICQNRRPLRIPRIPSEADVLDAAITVTRMLILVRKVYNLQRNRLVNDLTKGEWE